MIQSKMLANKTVKRIFVLAIAFIGLFTAVVVFANRAISTIGDDGFAVPASSGIAQILSGEGEDPIALVPVQHDDTVYKNALGYYVGEDRHPIDITFPLYVNGGVGLRFLDETNWLITPEVDVYQTYEGLYVSEGVSYNIDMTRADEDTFIFLMLQNGLFMNVQSAVFENRLGKTTIPINSILMLKENGLRWFEYKNGTLGLHSEESVFDATLTIGGQIYDYYDLLQALGLVRDAIEQGEQSRPNPDMLETAESVLTPNPGGNKEPTTGEDGLNPGESDTNPGEGDGNFGESGTGPSGDETNRGDGETTPGDSETESGNPGEHETNPGWNEGGTGEHETQPGQGDTPPVEGETDENGNPSGGDETGSGNPGEGETTAPEGETNPGDGGDGPGDNNPGDGSSPDDGNNPPDTDDMSPGDGYNPPEGESTPVGGESGNPGDGGHNPGDGDIEIGPGEDFSREDDSTGPIEPEDTKQDGDLGEDVGEGEGGGDDDVGGDAGNPGKPVIKPYQEPVVSLSDIDLWCYAVDMHLEVDDPSAAIPRGIKLAVYGKLKGFGLPTTDEEGNKIYSQDDYTGQSLMLRKTRSGTQDLALSPLEPGETVYIQFSYRYYQEVKEIQDVEYIDPETGLLTVIQQQVTVRKRVYYYSDFIEVTLPEVEDSEVKAVASNWTTEFAAYADAISMTGLTMCNTSAYDSEKAESAYDFENFKLDTLPYVNRMKLTLTPTSGGKALEIILNSSVLSRAQKGESTFKSSAPKLNSNTEYTITVSLTDRYGNDIPLIVNGQAASNYTETVYTCKRQPAVRIDEVKNVTDLLVVSLTVDDPDGAMDGTIPLVYTMLANETPVVLYGTWGNGTPMGSDDTKEIILEQPTHNKQYTLSLESLAFAQLFTAQVKGSYDPQPDAVDEPSIPTIANVQMGTTQIYTASLSDGYISFATAFSQVSDTSASVSATMTQNTTIDILPMVDEFRIYLKNPDGEVVGEQTHLRLEELSGTMDAFSDNIYVIEEGSYLAPQVQLYGASNQVAATPWSSFCISASVIENPDTGETEIQYSVPMQLQIQYPKGYFTNFTKYSLAIEAVVVKGGQEYYIPVNLTNTQFTTKKTIPVISFDDLFIASDVVSFADLRIFDPDATIQNGGALTAQLYYGNTLLSIQNMWADQTTDESLPVIDLTFDGLIAGGDYTIKFVAGAYNDEEGYGAYRQNYTLATYNIVGGSDLTGDLNLTELKHEADSGVNIAAGYTDTGYDNTLVHSSSTYKSFVKWNGYVSYAIPCEPLTTYEILYEHPATGNCYYGTFSTTQDAIDGVAGGNGLSIPWSQGNGYSAPTYSGNNARRVTTYENDNYIIVSCSKSTASIFAESLVIREYRPASPTATYSATVDVDVEDKKGYLSRGLEAGELPSVKLTLERSESMDLPEYLPYTTYNLTLEVGEEGGYELDLSTALTRLLPNSGWRATLTCYYQGRDIKLDQITFRTDADYIPVSSHLELRNAVWRNPYANVLVTSDFTTGNYGSISPYGIIDFQGHVVTRNPDYAHDFIYSVQNGAVIRNLVYDYPQQTYYLAQGRMIVNVYGMVENLIVRTYGQVEFNGSGKNIYNITQEGTLRNFIYKLGGDVILTADTETYPGLVADRVYGLIENGYVYGVNGAGLLQTGNENSAIFAYLYYCRGIRNMYVLLDNWQRVNDNGQLYTDNYFFNTGSGIAKGTFSNIYTVGDFYAISADLKKSYLLPLNSPQFSSQTSATVIDNMFHNVWCISGNANLKPSGINTVAGIAKLYDLDWQMATLGGGNFDVEGCVTMGFYPRLNLPTEMQKYQEYIALPAMATTAVPSIVGDSLADPAIYGQPGFKEATIKLRFKNDNMASITEVKIDNLVTNVLAQSVAADGLYDVIVSVQVDPTNESYVSSYHVSEITYVVGTTRRPITMDYNTESIEFWKTISTTGEWHNINRNMKWNYKLIADLDFTGVTPGQIVINGKLNNFDNTSGWAFSGKIDGQEHILKNITLSNISNAYVIAYLNTAGVVENLLIENMNISSSKTVKQYRMGFIGYGYHSFRLENIHIRNSSVTGGGSVALLIGEVAGSGNLLQGCSVTNSTLYDINTGGTLYAGALVGKHSGDQAYTRYCYTRDVKIDVGKSNSIAAVGGLIAWTSTSIITDCYSHGTLVAASSNVGGIIGEKTAGNSMSLGRCISYVEILQTAGDIAGGISGAGTVHHCSLVLGSVNGAGASSNRVCGTAQTHRKIYAWSGQKVGNLTDRHRGDATGLLTGDELAKRSTYQDIVELGDGWNYAPVDDGCLPLISSAYDCRNPDWQQVPIPIPGQSTDPAISVVDAIYDNSAADGLRYYLTIRFDHPGSTAEEVAEYYNSGNLSFNLEGMKMSEADVNDGKASIQLQHYGNANSERADRYTLIRIRLADFSLALDSYLFTLNYNDGRDRELSSMVSYYNRDGSLKINWLEISNLSEWNTAMVAHGQTEENILIMGVIDFNHGVMLHKNLRFNRLSGLDKETCGFVNMRYAGGNAGDSWIDRVTMDVSNLHFKNSTYIFDDVTVARNRTGLIQSVYNVTNIIMEDITMRCNYNGGSNFGFFCYSNGLVSHVKMKNITVTGHMTGSTRSYASALVAYTPTDVEHVEAENIIMNMPRHSYIGAAVGYQSTWYRSTANLKVTGLNIVGYTYVGGLIGYSLGGCDRCTVIGLPDTAMNVVEAKGSNAGGVSGYFGKLNTYCDNIHVKDMRITSTGNSAGGISGAASHTYISNALVENATIKTNASYAGGVLGNNSAYNYMRNVQILNCSVTAVNDYAGGIAGSFTSGSGTALYSLIVRNTQINGKNYVGGFAGYITREVASMPVHDRIYIAEDVIVSGSADHVGGMVGYTNRLALTNSISAATVTGRNAVGGIIGHIEPQADGTLAVTLQNIISAGQVSATTDYAGGLVGRLNSKTLKFEDNTLKNCLVTGSVTTPGENLSLWVTDTSNVGSAGKGTVYIWEHASLNGVGAKAAHDAAIAADQNIFVIPETDTSAELFVTSATLSTKDFYQTNLALGNVWDLSHFDTEGNLYLPFTKNYDKDGVLYYVNHKIDDTPAGILLPVDPPPAPDPGEGEGGTGEGEGEGEGEGGTGEGEGSGT